VSLQPAVRHLTSLFLTAALAHAAQLQGQALAASLDHCLQHAIKILYSTSAQKRSPRDREFVRSYKNDPRFRAWLWEHQAEFTDPEEAVLGYRHAGPEQIARATANAQLERAPVSVDLTEFGKLLPPGHDIFQSDPGRRNHPGMDIYHGAVLRLQAGDTVVFRDQEGQPHSFRLGDFLGSGNMTHIYALADRPDRVIRIPYAIEGRQNPAPNEKLKGPPVQHFARRYIEAIPNKPVKRVQIREHGPGFVVTDRINGNENGFDFLIKLLKTQGDRTDIDSGFEFWKYLSLLKNRGDQESHRKLKKLLTFSRQWGTGWQDQVQQLVWDRKTRDWVLVDWE